MAHGKCNFWELPALDRILSLRGLLGEVLRVSWAPMTYVQNAASAMPKKTNNGWCAQVGVPSHIFGGVHILAFHRIYLVAFIHTLECIPLLVPRAHCPVHTSWPAGHPELARD